MKSQFEGKTVVVTGGSKGIGKGIAKVFSEKGANVAIISRDLTQGQETANELKNNDNNVSAYTADVTSLHSLEKTAQTILGDFGSIDIVCANAGIFPSATIEDMTEEQWDHVQNINSKGTFFTVKAFMPYVKKAEYGRFILTSSITGPITGYAGWAHYGASKAAQLGFMRTAALELANYNITINAVSPGNILTEGLDGLGEEYLNSMAAAIPFKRLGTVDDIGHAATFFASKEANFITGQTLVVDGGQILPESIE
ncbi:3-oxoacyl-ACP reductase FabG [Sporosarcina sp. P21c]|uniref:3-oxoacyl-ACP reductase FabG n=1 Tax=Sporosarcina TaxID=1569 RepID=UPI000A148D50|nr:MULTISPECIES: 3-oxoacyl-ACP reductase FabG [Sporosarcina]ARJ39604.1 3-oxoacyl-[acyl-carrier-protein] reductase [Sporosarcina ureae]PIC68015.1 3-oxoacyl-ACP reductase FabG [Sporosarcina sp. P16a]PIC83112.1 3-oxoacyl-ACP reductase FabG [Sporosarcina sp. P1]PIC90940.1 3-oxoacyl-ACP reductase FabG [Sporosarcina sp. P21c]PIC94324.1 3-oxoacyl-ACP reductase FabG [Sporosarcina sp. P25]